MRNSILLWMLICLGSLNLNAQPNLPKAVADSLWGVWQDESQPDTARLKAIEKYARAGYLYSQPDSAFYYAQIQFTFSKNKGLKKQMALALSIQGTSFYIRKNYTEAIDYYTRSLKIAEEIGNKLGIANSLYNIGNIYKDQSDNAQALDYYTRSLKIRVEMEDKKGIAASLNNIGVIYKNQGDYAQAIDYFTRSLTIAEEIGNKLGIAASLGNIGVINIEQGVYKKAIYHLTSCLKIQEEVGNKKGIANTLTNIGIIYKNQGDYAQAMDYYTRSLKIREDMGDKQGIATSLNNIGLIYFDQGDFDKAIDVYTFSLKIREDMGDKEGVATSLNNIGLIYENHGNYTQAIDYHTRSLKNNEKIGNKPGIATSLNNIGIIYRKQGDYTQAIDFNTRNLKIVEELGNKKGIVASLINFGGIYYDQHEYALAVDYSSHGLALAKEIGAGTETRLAARDLILYYALLGSTERATEMADLLQSLRLEDLDINFSILSEPEKEKYFATMQSDFDILIDFALQHPQLSLQTEKAYNNALLTKGLTLKSSTAMRQAIQNCGDTLLINDYEKWLFLKKKIANLNETDSTYKNMVNQANDMERDLVKKSTIFSDFDKVRNLRWQDVQAGLKPGEAAIEFVHFKSEIDTTNPVVYAALIVKRESEHPEMIRLCTEADLTNILGALQGNNLSFVNAVYGSKEQAQTALYEKVWKPMEKSLSGVKNVYLSPSGLLHKVAFSAIAKGQNTYLCDVYNIRQQSSTGKIALPDDVAFNKNTSFLLMGGVQYNTDSTANEVWAYLPGTLEEICDIASILKKNKYIVTQLTANQTTEDTIKSKVPEVNVLHLSTHGFFFADPDQVREEMKNQTEYQEDLVFRGNAIHPEKMQRSTRYANWTFVKNQNPLMRSGLALAHANDVWQRPGMAEGEDGVLTASEVSTLDLRNTDLVVLSACETGLGDIKGSEGVFGLQRAFKIAGAKYIIMSLWQVPDKETAEFMTTFYKQLSKSGNIKESFAKTQHAMRKKYDPYYWAAFVLVE
jgi:CHAT domain-containing protein/Tfp pilus assembly protein PilF